MSDCKRPLYGVFRCRGGLFERPVAGDLWEREDLRAALAQGGDGAEAKSLALGKVSRAPRRTFKFSWAGAFLFLQGVALGRVSVSGVQLAHSRTCKEGADQKGFWVWIKNKPTFTRATHFGVTNYSLVHFAWMLGLLTCCQPMGFLLNY